VQTNKKVDVYLEFKNAESHNMDAKRGSTHPIGIAAKCGGRHRKYGKVGR